MAQDPLQELVRMAFEADDLERGPALGARAANGAAARRRAPVIGGTAAGRPDHSLSHRGGRSAAGWILGAGAALAAGIGISALWMHIAPPHQRVAVMLRHLPPGASANVAGRSRNVITYQAVAPEPLAMLAVFRGWNRECECVAWRLYDWTDGQFVTRADEAHPSEISLDVTGAPPADQLLVIAASSEHGQLPDEPAETDALLACLNETPVPPEAERDVTALASAVRSCLPAGVTVVPERLVIDHAGK